MSRGLRKKLQNVHNWSDCTNLPRHFLPASYFLNNSLLIFLIPPGYNRKQEKLLSFFFIFLPLFFSENTPMRSGQPCRGIFMLSHLFPRSAMEFWLLRRIVHSMRTLVCIQKPQKHMSFTCGFSAKRFVAKCNSLLCNLSYIRVTRPNSHSSGTESFIRHRILRFPFELGFHSLWDSPSHIRIWPRTRKERSYERENLNVHLKAHRFGSTDGMGCHWKSL